MLWPFSPSFYFIHFITVIAFPLLPWSHPNPIIFFSSLTLLFFSFSVVPCLFTALILSGPPQCSFTFQVKNNSAYRILPLSKHDWRQIPSSTFLRKKCQLFQDYRMFHLPRRCFHRFLMACEVKESREVMPLIYSNFAVS